MATYKNMQEVVKLTEFERLNNLLYQFSIYRRHSAHTYVTVSVTYAQENPMALQALMKQLYPATAKCCHASVPAVERGIRKASERAWVTNPELLCKLAQHKLTQPPTNGDFLCMLCHYLDHPDILEDLE